MVDGIDPDIVARRLSDEYGIGVRAGLFCAHPFTRSLTWKVGQAERTGSAVRASLGVGTTPHSVDRLLAAVSAIATS